MDDVKYKTGELVEFWQNGVWVLGYVVLVPADSGGAYTLGVKDKPGFGKGWLFEGLRRNPVVIRHELTAGWGVFKEEMRYRRNPMGKMLSKIEKVMHD